MWKSLVLSAIVCLVGCGGSTEPKNGVAGVYGLRVFEGSTVPFKYFDNGDGGTFWIVSGSFNLKSNGRYLAITRESTFFCGACQSPPVADSHEIVVDTSGGAWAEAAGVVTLTDTVSFAVGHGNVRKDSLLVGSSVYVR